MKLKFISVVILILLAFQIQAQMPHRRRGHHSRDLGLKLGGNFDNFHGDAWSDSYHTGLNGGLFAGMREYYLGVQAELLLSSARYTPNYGSTDIKNLYLSVPAMLEIRLTPNLWAQVGPEYSVLVSSKTSTGNENFNGFSSVGATGVAGLQLFLPYHLALGARYVFSLSNWDANSGSNEWKIRSLQFYLGFRMR